MLAIRDQEVVGLQVDDKDQDDEYKSVDSQESYYTNPSQVLTQEKEKAYYDYDSNDQKSKNRQTPQKAASPLVIQW